LLKTGHPIVFIRKKNSKKTKAEERKKNEKS
jgi:hypothetical protein